MISAKEAVKRVKEGGRPFAYGTFKGYNRRGLIPEKKSASTDDGKLIWVYPERTVEIVERIIDERNRGANLDYISTLFWLDIAFAEMPEKKLNLIKGHLGDYTINNPDERGRVLCALASGLEFIEELRQAHVPEEKLQRLFFNMWKGIKLLVLRHQSKITEEEFKAKFENPDPEFDQKIEEFAVEWFALSTQQEEEAKNRAA